MAKSTMLTLSEAIKNGNIIWKTSKISLKKSNLMDIRFPRKTQKKAFLRLKKKTLKLILLVLEEEELNIITIASDASSTAIVNHTDESTIK